jgi:hypothetical protein
MARQMETVTAFQHVDATYSFGLNLGTLPSAVHAIFVESVHDRRATGIDAGATCYATVGIKLVP